MNAATQQELVEQQAAPEAHRNVVLSVPAQHASNTASVRCAVCGVLQSLPAASVEVGEWMPCALCWRAMSRAAKLALLPRFTTHGPDAQASWRHRFTLLGVTDAELRTQQLVGVEAGESADPRLAADAQLTEAERPAA